jgi:hypothetical protein
VRAVEPTDRVGAEAFQAPVLEPRDTLVGLERDAVVERVPVRQQEVDVAVSVEIGCCEVARAPGRVRRSIQDALALVSRRIPWKKHRYGLVLLGECHHKARTRPRQKTVDRDGGHRACPVDDALWAEVERVPDGLVVQHVHPALVQVPERGDDQVEIAVEVEVRRADVGDATDPLDEGSKLELVDLALQCDEDAPRRVVRRQRVAEIGDQEIVEAVSVEITRRHARRMLGLSDQARALRPRKEMDAAERHVGHGEQRPDAPDRRDPRPARTPESDRTVVEAKGPGLVTSNGMLHRQLFGRPALVPGNEALDVEIG